MNKPKWKCIIEVDDKVVKARKTRSEILVRVEKADDPETFEEWEMSLFFDYETAMHQAAIQTVFKETSND